MNLFKSFGVNIKNPPLIIRAKLFGTAIGLMLAVLVCTGCNPSEQNPTAAQVDKNPNAELNADPSPASSSAQKSPAAKNRPRRNYLALTNLTKQQIEDADLSVLFVGNSHSHMMPQMMTVIADRNIPETKTLFLRSAYAGFLFEHVEAGMTKKIIETGPWDYVVLQAQKYSTSGKYEYPHAAALELSRAATSVGAKIIMYPEWARKGIPQEYARVKALHEMIAQKTGATVAPIGEAWEAVIKEYPAMNLYASDGNHASTLGSYLNSCIFYSMITGKSAENTTAPQQPEFEFYLRQLERIAWEQVDK